ncbi:MAG: HDOD domain-containing protein [Deltaproteobacteria bacterium]|nr:HDOD domain-containing protein [Deltaproteobacteria bacterium]
MMEPGYKKRILFVDDEPRILQGLRRMLYAKRGEWEFDFAEDGPSALALLEAGGYDVVVSDMRMPGMTGAQLLSEVKKRHPRVTRIILSGQSDLQWVMQSVGVAHQFLAKPCEFEVLEVVLSRTFALSALLEDPTLKQVIGLTSSLPSLPSLYLEIRREMESEDCSLERVGRIVSRDMAMTAKVLQLVNSAFFGLPQKIANPAQAVLFLGLKTLETLILSLHIFSGFRQGERFGSFVADLWEHSLLTSELAKAIAWEETRDRALADEAAMAGLLHDCGKLVLADNFPDRYAQVLTRSAAERLPVWQVEEEIFGTSHGLVGAYLLGLWGLPHAIIETLAFSHHPQASPLKTFSVLTAVHGADSLISSRDPEEKPGSGWEMKTDYLESLGLLSSLSAWRELVFRNKGGNGRPID